MKQIVLVNGLGFGREVAEWISLMPGYGRDFKLKGFLDNRNISATFLNLPTLGNPEEYIPEVEDYMVIALADPAAKANLVNKFREKSSRFFSVIHPGNQISDSAIIGEGAIFAPFNSVSAEAEIGDFVCLYGFNRIGHNAKIGHFSHLASHISIGGNAVVPKNSRLPDFFSLAKNEFYESE